MIDSNGYRSNVAIIIMNRLGRVLLAKRVSRDSWQFPQGGIDESETPIQAMYRELREEVGLESADVRVIDCSHGWLRYRLPKHLIRKPQHTRLKNTRPNNPQPLCIGQKQKWFLISLQSPDEQVRLDMSEAPEFDGWSWVSYWYPLTRVAAFKKNVYRKALTYFAFRMSHAQSL